MTLHRFRTPLPYRLDPQVVPLGLDPLIAELDALGAVARPEGRAVLCLDAIGNPPSGPLPRRVVALATPTRDDDLIGGALGPWIEAGATVIVPTRSDARIVREHWKLGPERIGVAPRPFAPPAPSADPDPASSGSVVAIAPDFAVLFRALRVLRRLSVARRVTTPATPAALRLVRPGGLLGLHDIVADDDLALTAADADPLATSCAAFVLSDTRLTDGALLRSLLATGRPVVAPANPAVRDHLASLGVNAYLWEPHEGAQSLAEALSAALADGRGSGLGVAARDAVSGESWTPVVSRVARGLAPPPRRLRRRHRPRGGDRMRLTVLTPWEAGVSGALFLGEVLRSLSAEEPGLSLKVVATSPPAHLAPERGPADEGWPAEVVEVPRDDMEAALSAVASQSDVVWCAWARHLDPPRLPCPLVATIHDLNWRHFDSMSPGQIAESDRVTPEWVDAADAVVCSSEAIRSEIRSAYGVAAGGVHVVPLTVLPRPGDVIPDDRLQDFRRSRSLPERFLLYPAVRSPHKNHAILKRAAELLRASGRPISLVLTGGHTDAWYHGPDVIGLGYVSDRDLDALYRLSCGVVLPSLYEAGSFPMWEAMRALRPVACSAIPAHLEQLRRTQAEALVFDPTPPLAAARAMEAFFTGSHGIDDIALARNAAGVSRRDWRHVAAGYREIFKAVASGRP